MHPDYPRKHVLLNCPPIFQGCPPEHIADMHLGMLSSCVSPWLHMSARPNHFNPPDPLPLLPSFTHSLSLSLSHTHTRTQKGRPRTRKRRSKNGEKEIGEEIQAKSKGHYHYKKIEYPWGPAISLRGEIKPQGYIITLRIV